MSIFKKKKKMGLIPFELKNAHNVKSKCVPFIAVISNLTQEEKYAVYEDNYYRLQEYINLGKELGIDVKTYFKVKEQGYIYRMYDFPTRNESTKKALLATRSELEKFYKS